MSDKRQCMIDALNSLEINEWSASCGELEYVLAEGTEENVQTLLEGGFKKEMVLEAQGGFPDNDIDLTHLAFNYAGIYCWHKDIGFCEEDEWNRLAAAQGAV
mgnify:CR=1 FL=1|jgi:hypothetical protein